MSRHPDPFARFCRFSLALAILLANVLLLAHEARPVAVMIKETLSNRYEVRWQVPLSVSAKNIPDMTLESDSQGVCTPLNSRQVIYDPGAYALRRTWHCRGELSKVNLTYPLFNPSLSCLMRLERFDPKDSTREVHSQVLDPDQQSWQIPPRETATGVAKSYFSLGVRHILTGYDHLLFLACLLFIAGSWKRILVTVTGFTLAHSFTLALSALGYLNVPVPAVEAVIALSILFVATEIARGPRNTLTWRYPIVVAASFGLLHGLGFAAALSETGLPQTEVTAALLFFNIGVEAGQVMAIAAAMLLGIAMNRLEYLAWMSRLYQPFVYGIGTFAAFLTWQRVLLF